MMSISRFFIYTAILFIPIVEIYSQSSILEIIGTAESDLKPLANAKAILYKNGAQIQTVYTKSNGEFKFDLDINDEYLIEVQKTGFLSKRIAFNTEIPNEVTGRWTIEFAIGLFQGCEGVNTSALDDPVDRIKYSSNKADFISDEGYVRNMRGRIDKLLQNIDNCQNDKYQSNLDEGNRLMSEGEYEAAANKFEEALNIYPDDKTAQRKLTEAEQAAGESVMNERRYNIAISQADRLLTDNDLEAARAKFTEALTFKSQSDYARSKIAEIDAMIAAKQQATQEKQEIENAYNRAIAQANAAYNSKNYETAKGFYEQALVIKPDAPLARQKITELEPLITKQKQEILQQEANEKAYLEALAMGESAFQSNDLESARQHFNRAAMLKPEESYPQQKIAEVDRILDERRTANLQAEKVELRKKIEESHDEGDAFLAQNNYEAAEAAYNRALQLDPNDTYAKQQINKVKSLQASVSAQKQKALEKAFTEAVDNGDKLLAAASYEQAIEAYKQALLQKPDDLQAKTKLAEAERRYAAEQQLRDAQYTRTIQEADNLFSLSRLVEAKASYQRALGLKPDKTYPQQRIARIDEIFAEQERKENEKKVANQQYTELISRADALLAAKQYDQAKTTYEQALALKSTEVYPRQKIAQIDEVLREQERQLATQRTRDEQYRTTIAEADNLLASLKLTEARLAYQKALTIKPSETYPQQQITKIDNLIAEEARRENEQRTIEQQYNTAIAQADKLYNENKLEEAKVAYQKALGFKSNEAYPTSQIAKIDTQLAQIEKEHQERAAFEQQYNNIIASADKAYDQRDYPSAKTAYMEALKLKPGEKYPQQRLNKIAEFERILAVQEANRNVTTTTTSANQTTSPKPSKLADLNFANDSERDKYLNGLKKQYPEGITLEIHKDKTFTTNRYVVIRGNEVREFRMVKFNWGGVEYSLNGIPISGQYFETQVKQREGEFFQKFEF